MDQDLVCSSELLSDDPSPASDASLIFDGLRMTTPPTHPDSTSDSAFADVFYMSDVNSVLLPDIETILPSSVMCNSTDETLSVDVGNGGDPWDSISPDPFSLSHVSNVYASSGPMISDFTQQPMTLATNTDFSSSFVVTCSDNMCTCDAGAYPKTIALDCDVIGVSRLVSDKGCQSYVNVSPIPVEVPEVDSSTGRSRDKVGKECALCCKSFTRLDKHVKYVHGPKKNCYCKEGKDKKAKGVLIRSCRVCNESFPKYSLLRAHVRANHPEEIESSGQQALPPCKYCGRKFNSEQKLRDHIVSHSGKYRYQCDMCEKGFAVVTDLQRHRRTHTGDRPYSCELCAKQFTQSGSLNRHKRNVHKIIVPKVD